MKTVNLMGAACAAILLVGLLLFATPLRNVVVPAFWKVFGPPLVQNLHPKLRRNETATRKTTDQFFNYLQHNEWAKAHAFLTPDCQKVVTVQTLQNDWQAMEAKRGKNIGWAAQTVKESLWPDYLEQEFRLQGTKGAGKVSLRTAQQRGGLWQIEKVIFTP